MCGMLRGWAAVASNAHLPYPQRCGQSAVWHLCLFTGRLFLYGNLHEYAIRGMCVESTRGTTGGLLIHVVGEQTYYHQEYTERSEAKFFTRSSQHEAKRSSLHKVPNTERSEVLYTKFPTRSEAKFFTQSSLHGAKRSSLHEVPYTERSEVLYTKFPTRSEVPYTKFPTRSEAKFFTQSSLHEAKRR